MNFDSKIQNFSEEPFNNFYFPNSLTDIESPEGIAIDCISRRIYWTDSVKDTIEVASLEDPTLRAVVINKNLVNPRGIAVDPYREYVILSKQKKVLFKNISTFIENCTGPIGIVNLPKSKSPI